MTNPLVPPLPEPQSEEFIDNSMVPVWREFWTKLLISVNSVIDAAVTLTTTVTALSASEAALSAAFSKAILAPCLVSALPAATANTNTRGMATDSTLDTTTGIGQVVVGGGGNFVPVFSDSLVWRIG
jgi:hypothetical protein